MGDVVLASPLIRCLRNKFPSAVIDFAVKKQYSDIVSADPRISGVVPFDCGIYAMWKKIRAAGYDYIIDIHGNTASWLVTQFSGAKVLKYKNHLLKRLMLVEFGLNFYDGLEPVPLRYIKAAAQLGIAPDGQSTDFYSVAWPEPPASGAAGRNVGICPVAVWNTKRWPAERYAELGAKLVDKFGVGVLVFGGRGDRKYCDSIAAQIGVAAKAVCAGSVQETAAGISSCKVVVTNDTGVLHISEAVKVPVVAIFGPTAGEFGFYPQLPASTTVCKELSCRPCSTKGASQCPVGDFVCMKDISVEEVFSHCASYL
jgi:heptosyltransferase-2